MVYASPNPKKRVVVWNQLLSIAPSDNEPWVLRVILMRLSRLMNEVVVLEMGGLLDLGYVSTKFTWGKVNLFQRLVRCIGNKDWINMFPNSLVKHLEQIGSDHRPLLLTIHNRFNRPCNKFRFLAAWQNHFHFKGFLQSVWDSDKDALMNIDVFTRDVKKWNLERAFGCNGPALDGSWKEIEIHKFFLTASHRHCVNRVHALRLDSGE
ncbi:reverse transcriptase [Gossypium australe]|uniref:Reverse transcriptase n=1 Tax=Gossypium australe TaxID=47621 RepID=A0A5B6V5G5_9ROSI|nr:reverse transcriptase [Gossypium australe]